MENNEKTMNEKLRFFLDVLLFGSIWGILEATLGTILHLPFIEGVKMYFSSSTIMIPLAFLLMTMCYKRTGKLYSVVLMGVLAGLIKLSTGFVLPFTVYVYCPAIYIVVEALAMFGALAVFRPEKVLSLKTFGSFVLANTTYMLSYVIIRMGFGGADPFTVAGWTSAEKYVFTINCIAMLYSLGIGSIAYGVKTLLEKHNVQVKFDYRKIVYSPITASIAFVIAVALTVSLAVL